MHFLLYSLYAKLGVKKLKKKTNSKDNKKKDKKKKSVFGRIIKIILLIILLGLLGYGAWFGYGYFKHVAAMDGRDYDPLSATALGIDPNKLKDVKRINVLVLGESGIGDGYKLTDTIMIASYNPQTQQASILSIPRDTYVGKKNKESASMNYLASYKMNSVYRNGTNIPETIERVEELTGLDIDNYILVDTDAVIEIVDLIGGVRFNVPIDMDYDDGNQDLHIHLKAGEQLIDGAKAEQLLRFRHNQDGSSYPTEYGDNDLGRMRTQREFIQETAKQLLKIENATKVVNLLDIAFSHVKTDLELQEIKYYIPYAFKFNTENIMTGTLPGVPELVNQVWIYTANKKQTKELVEEMFTDKEIVDEENTNTISNTSTNEITNKTENTVTNTTSSSSSSSSSTTSSSTTKNLKIEIINNSGSDSALEKAKEKLEKKGYTVSKTETSKSTSATSIIINRTKNSESTSNSVKETLGYGKIQSGSSKSNIDYTIIIGKDYK